MDKEGNETGVWKFDSRKFPNPKEMVKQLHELGFKVIAEGVETKEQAEFLSNIDCTIAQGYLYDKPLTLDEFETRLDKDFKYSV